MHTKFHLMHSKISMNTINLEVSTIKVYVFEVQRTENVLYYLLTVV